MDDGRGFLYEIGAAAVVCGGAAVLGLAFKAAPVVTILGGSLLAIVVGVALFVYLDRRADPPLGRGRVVFLVVMFMGFALGSGLLLWAAYCTCVA